MKIELKIIIRTYGSIGTVTVDSRSIYKIVAFDKLRKNEISAFLSTLPADKWSDVPDNLLNDTAKNLFAYKARKVCKLRIRRRKKSAKANVMCFYDWLYDNGYGSKDDFYKRMAIKGHSKDMINEKWYDMRESHYYRWCWSNDMEPED